MRPASTSALVIMATVLLCVDAARLQDTPASRVVTLIEELEGRIQADGKQEQQSYDKYACWVEDTLQRKASDISNAKETIESLETKMKELKGEIASHAAEMVQLKKDIAENVESQREANEVREKETMEYTEEKTESEQCIGALEAAIKVLNGAGTGKKGFLETMKEAQLLSVVAGVRGLLKTPAATKKINSQDLDLVKRFVDRPDDFVGGRVGVMSAAQIANNPFGDYAPQSTQIQGILKGMYDTFAADLEKANADEADQQKSHEELMETKRMELNTLEATLDKQTSAKASKNKELAESKQLRDDTQDQLEADEVFFENTKKEGKVKATEWSERTRLRTEELQGIATAVRILSSPEAQATFETSGTTLVQTAQLSTGSRNRAKAYERLRDLASKSHSFDLASIAVAVKNGGHFDKIISSIDKMIELLRREEQSDIEHRDRCQNSQRKNSQDTEDIGKAIGKSEARIEQLGKKEDGLTKKINELGGQMTSINKTMTEALDMRNSENNLFKEAMKTDTDAIALLDRAIVSLARFYKANNIPFGLMQKRKEDPKYSEDQDKAPETTWSGAAYGGRKSESEGIIAILRMLKEDLQKEITVAQQEEADAQKAYLQNRADAQSMMDTAKASKVATEQDLAEATSSKATEEGEKESSKKDKQAQSELQSALGKDCDWVKTHFETRRSKRKAEMDGLVEAKGYLAGVENGDSLSE